MKLRNIPFSQPDMTEEEAKEVENTPVCLILT